ncbi:hypothetical protein [Humibacillus xanthopallidus]|uniref:hypothetical protein n=1 Tax=Humibacillus xanthopallidus TaxID=412689 RepID=UPI00384CE2EA
MAKPAAPSSSRGRTDASTAQHTPSPTTTGSPSAAQGIERAKVLSVRLSTDEFERLTDLATEIGVGPSTLARTLIRRGLTPAAQPDSPLERAHLQRLLRQPPDLEELTARVAALEAWVASHPAHDAS